jgi:hypothetical protein
MTVTSIGPVHKDLGNGHFMVTSLDFDDVANKLHVHSDLTTTNKVSGFHGQVRHPRYCPGAVLAPALATRADRRCSRRGVHRHRRLRPGPWSMDRSEWWNAARNRVCHTRDRWDGSVHRRRPCYSGHLLRRPVRGSCLIYAAFRKKTRSINKIGATDTEDQLSIVDHRVPVGFAPPPHIHQASDQAFLVPGLHLLDLAGPAQAFRTAADLGCRYELRGDSPPPAPPGTA